MSKSFQGILLIDIYSGGGGRGGGRGGGFRGGRGGGGRGGFDGGRGRGRPAPY